MFIDSVEIYIESGKGGAGGVSFRREKYVLQGGPDGGDGGRGGDIYFKVDKNATTLANFRGNKKFKAQNGCPGKSSRCSGKKGEDIIIKVPPGTQVINLDNQEIIFDLVNDGEMVKALSGGRGGLGNVHFKNSRNQAPTYAQPGLPGQSLNIGLELKLIADIALVGFPNAGKSSLISIMTNSKPKIANYAFSTLIPNLGVVDIDHSNSFVLADIPGLIEGASDGRGLGISFLRHIERTKLILFMIDIQNKDNNELDILRQELKNYSPTLFNRPFGLVYTKIDLLDECNDTEMISPMLKDSQDLGIGQKAPAMHEPLFILNISSISHINIDKLRFLLLNALKYIQS